jgi:hypothetical protein
VDFVSLSADKTASGLLIQMKLENFELKKIESMIYKPLQSADGYKISGNTLRFPYFSMLYFSLLD